jgi:hypothetical protein
MALPICGVVNLVGQASEEVGGLFVGRGERGLSSLALRPLLFGAIFGKNNAEPVLLFVSLVLEGHWQLLTLLRPGGASSLPGWARG